MIYLTFTYKTFCYPFILESNFIFANLLNSGVSIGFRYFTFSFCCFCIHSSLRGQINNNIYFTFKFCCFYIGSNHILVMSDILFSIYMTFVLRAAVLTKPPAQSIFFSVSVISVLQPAFLAPALELVIFLSTSSVLFSMPYFSHILYQKLVHQYLVSQYQQH